VDCLFWGEISKVLFFFFWLTFEFVTAAISLFSRGKLSLLLDLTELVKTSCGAFFPSTSSLPFLPSFLPCYSFLSFDLFFT